MRSQARYCLIFVAMLIITVLWSRVAQAAGVVGTGSPASCSGSDLTTALSGGGLVTFNCGVDPFTIPSATHVIQQDTIIRGDNKITLTGENLRQLFIVSNNVTLTLNDIILLDGEFASGGCVSVAASGTFIAQHVTFQSCRDISVTLGGGAVYNLGRFTATDSTFLLNEAVNEGGAVFNRGSFTTSRVLFEANKSADDGGAIKNVNDGILLIEDSIFLGNIAQDSGGAIDNTLSFPTSNGSVNILRTLLIDNNAVNFGGGLYNGIGGSAVGNSTFIRNTADQGGGVYSEDTATTSIIFSTFNDNRADIGAGIYRPLTGVVQLQGTILFGGRNQANTNNNLQCDGPTLTSLGYNLVSDGSCVDGANGTDLRDTPPDLGPLQDNGGFSQTQMPNITSPALGKVPSNVCPPRDQRHAWRIGNCDIGAAEFGGPIFIVRVGK